MPKYFTDQCIFIRSLHMERSIIDKYICGIYNDAYRNQLYVKESVKSTSI